MRKLKTYDEFVAELEEKYGEIGENEECPFIYDEPSYSFDIETGEKIHG